MNQEIVFFFFNFQVPRLETSNYYCFFYYYFYRTMKLSPYASSLHCSLYIKRVLSIIGLIPGTQDWKFNRI